MLKRDRCVALAGAILLSIALPIAMDQGYFRNNAYILPVAALFAVILYLVYFLTTNISKKLIRKFYFKYPRLSVITFIIIGLFIIGGLIKGEMIALQKSKDHLAKLQSEENIKKSYKTDIVPSLQQAAILPSSKEAKKEARKEESKNKPNERPYFEIGKMSHVETQPVTLDFLKKEWPQVPTENIDNIKWMKIIICFNNIGKKMAYDFQSTKRGFCPECSNSLTKNNTLSSANPINNSSSNNDICSNEEFIVFPLKNNSSDSPLLKYPDIILYVKLEYSDAKENGNKYEQELFFNAQVGKREIYYASIEQKKRYYLNIDKTDITQ